MSMHLKFEFKKTRSSQSIVAVNIDEDGNIESVSCSDIMLEKRLVNNPNEFQKFIKCTVVSGSICSDQVDVGHVTYTVQQLP